jgi:alpha-beta hydrolase superfamily lysophospholipase
MNRDEKTGIAYRRWVSHTAKGTFILIHGLGAHTGRWAALSRHLVNNGFSSYALELRGFGHTKGAPGYVNSFETYLSDITRLREIAMKERPGKKIFLLGESMGALAVFLAAIEKPDAFDGAVLISPAFTSRLKFKLLEYVDISLAMLLNPKKTFNMPFNSAMCTRDLEYQKLLDASHAEHRVASAKLLLAIALVQLRSRFAIEKIKIPTLFLVAGDDQLVDPNDTMKLFKAIKFKDKRMIGYPDMRHALSIELGKEKVFRDITDWASARC